MLTSTHVHNVPHLTITLVTVSLVPLNVGNALTNHPCTLVSGLNSLGDSVNAVPIRLRGVGVGFPAIRGISAGITPVMSCISYTHAQIRGASRRTMSSLGKKS